MKLWPSVNIFIIGVKPEAVARAIELSEEKYCSVRGMFGPQVEVVTSYRIIETER